MASKLLLSGKVAVITGAASKTGQAIARRFVDHGAKVILADLNHSTCKNIAVDLNKTNANNTRVAHAMPCDVTDPSKILKAVEEAKNVYNQDLDIFYNNAGINDLCRIGVDNFKNTMAVNVESVLASIEHAGAAMRRSSKGGSILCTGSTMGLFGDVVPSAYSISKAAVLGVVRAAAAELASDGVRVNAISPRRVAPGFDRSVLRPIFPHATDQQLDDMINNYVTSRLVTEEAVANAAVYLASDASKGVSGHNLVLNGEFPLVI